MRAAAIHLHRAAKSPVSLLRRLPSSSQSVLSPLPVPCHTTSCSRALVPFPTPRRFSSDEYFSDGLSESRERILLLTEKLPHLRLHVIPDDLLPKISDLASTLLSLPDDNGVPETLDSGPAAHLMEKSPDGAAFVELLSQLKSRPLLALEVFNWRKKKEENGTHPIQSEEYVKAITLAGRARNLELATELFFAATTDRVRTTSTYNAMMAVYMYNGITKKSLAYFDDLKRDKNCSPTIVTYNILLSVFGRSLLINHMETILDKIKESKLIPNIFTYNTLIAGYLTAWSWGKMECTFMEMDKGPVKPDTSTHLLMLRGYAHAGELDKMESTYELVKEHVQDRETKLLRTMICAYCKSSDPERVRKIEELMEHIPQEQYRSWLHVLLIRLYAQERMMEKMESFISEAFKRETVVVTVDIMRSIITSYFRCGTVDKLSEFIKKAESAGWRLCLSLYHCKMVMYGRQKRFSEMHHVLDEMEAFKLSPCKRTFLIMYKAYSDLGKNSDAEKILGLMCKHGFAIPMDGLN